MNNPVQILIPVSSNSSAFPDTDYFFPKPLIEISGTPMIQRVVEHYKTYFPQAHFIFVVEKAVSRKFSLKKLLHIICGENVSIIERNGETQGALCSALLAYDVINFEHPLLIANSDMVVESDLNDDYLTLKNMNCSAGIWTFNSLHPRWSYVVPNKAGGVEQCFEKDVMSNIAIAGLYYFRKAHFFIEAAEDVILNDAQVDGNFYVSATLNQIILSGGTVKYLMKHGDIVASFHTPKSIREYENKKNAQVTNRTETSNLNLVIPAAGEGSRFQSAGWKRPKPFIDVGGTLMVNRVIENLKSEKFETTVILKAEHIERYTDEVATICESGASISSIRHITEGTACTVLSIHSKINNEYPLIIANSDQIVDFNIDLFVSDCLQRDLDGSIVTFKNVDRDKKWSYAKTNDDGYVTAVAEKQPISDDATVGIYLFRKGADFVNASIDMIVANERVNGEFYTCPVYNYMIAKGAKIGVYEIEPSDMHGIGTPNDLVNYLDNLELPKSNDMPQ